MGAVVAATHTQLEQRVALKVLLPELLENKQAVERFLREGKAAGQLSSDHVCRVLDVALLDDGAPYLVMELLDGCDLERLLLVEGSLPVSTAAAYVLQACIGLAEAHAHGIVHRDLKPANLFLSRRADESPLIKVLDFGIAKLTVGVKCDLTATTSVMGSPNYMSPEQLRSSREADPRSDLWALGVILYELVSGKKPFIADSITDLTLRIAMDAPSPLRQVAPEFNEVVFRCLEKSPEHRFADVADFAHALGQAVGPEVMELANTVSKVLYAGRPEAALEATMRRRRVTITNAAVSINTSETPRRSSWRSAALWIGAAGILGGFGWGIASSATAPLRASNPAAEDRPSLPAPSLPDPLPVATTAAGPARPIAHGAASEALPSPDLVNPTTAVSASTAGGRPLPSPLAFEAPKMGDRIAAPLAGTGEVGKDVTSAAAASRRRHHRHRRGVVADGPDARPVHAEKVDVSPIPPPQEPPHPAEVTNPPEGAALLIVDPFK
jgi:eukaryotic-like serine/threonine-protein kinase